MGKMFLIFSAFLDVKLQGFVGSIKSSLNYDLYKLIDLNSIWYIFASFVSHGTFCNIHGDSRSQSNQMTDRSD